MSKKTMLCSLRMDRDSYFKITLGKTSLMATMDRDRSWVTNKAIRIGLLALGAGMPVATEADITQAALYAQAERLRELERHVRDIPPIEMEAGVETPTAMP